jgi:mono/diheme cytochrome c family protein
MYCMIRYVALWSGVTVAAGAISTLDPDAQHVAKFFTTHCVDCHDADKLEGDFHIEPLILAPKITDSGNAFDWELILDVLNLEEMPPEKKPRPETADLLATIRWITSNLEQHHNSKVAKPSALRRLNQAEYRNTIRDLLGIEFDPSAQFPADEVAEGFDNVGQALRVSPTLLEKYLIAAEHVTARAIVAGKRPAELNIVATGNDLECDPSLGIKRDGGIELVSGREFRSRIFSQPTPIYEGNYRVKITVDPYRAHGEAVRVNLRSGPATNGPATLKNIEVFSITETTTLDLTVPLRPGETVHVSYPDGPQFPNNNAAADYTGPGIFVRKIETIGPLLPQWPLPGHRRLFAPAEGKRDLSGAENILRAFAYRAYRGPVTPEDLTPLVATFQEQSEAGADFEASIRASVQLALCSPKFIFLNLASHAQPGKQISAYELATRLSYFLWSAPPDEVLMALASSGKLLESGELSTQTERLLYDPRSEAFVSNFVGQWLKMREVGTMKPDRRFFPSYDGSLGAAMRHETEAFFTYLLQQNESIYNVLDSNFTMLNERLADHYGIPQVKGDEFRKVNLDPTLERGGVLGHASFHMITSNGTHTSPVARGVYVLSNLLGTPPPEPPPNINPIEPDTRGTTTMREQIEKHRNAPTCFECHQLIDPIGLALEGFDPVGYRRTHYLLPAPGGKTKEGPTVLTSTETADGRALSGANDLRDYLMARKHLFAHHLTEKLLVYSTGRKPTFQDGQEVLNIAFKLEDSDSGLRSLVHKIVQSKAFSQR